MVRSFRWLGCCPVTAEIVGSSPIRTAPRQAQYYKIDKWIQVRFLSASGGCRGAFGKHIY